MKEVQRKKQVYITDAERKKCKRVMNAFEELYRTEDIVVADVGKYGFVKLQYYKAPYGFDEVATFTDSRDLFTELWMEWRNSRLLELSKNTPIADLGYCDIFRCLSKEDRRKIIKKRHYFAKKAGMRYK